MIELKSALLSKSTRSGMITKRGLRLRNFFRRRTAAAAAAASRLQEHSDHAEKPRSPCIGGQSRHFEHCVLNTILKDCGVTITVGIFRLRMREHLYRLENKHVSFSPSILEDPAILKRLLPHFMDTRDVMLLLDFRNQPTEMVLAASQYEKVVGLLIPELKLRNCWIVAIHVSSEWQVEQARQVLQHLKESFPSCLFTLQVFDASPLLDEILVYWLFSRKHDELQWLPAAFLMTKEPTRLSPPDVSRLEALYKEWDDQFQALHSKLLNVVSLRKLPSEILVTTASEATRQLQDLLKIYNDRALDFFLAKIVRNDMKTLMKRLSSVDLSFFKISQANRKHHDVMNTISEFFQVLQEPHHLHDMLKMIETTPALRSHVLDVMTAHDEDLKRFVTLDFLLNQHVRERISITLELFFSPLKSSPLQVEKKSFREMEEQLVFLTFQWKLGLLLQDMVGTNWVVTSMPPADGYQKLTFQFSLNLPSKAKRKEASLHPPYTVLMTFGLSTRPISIETITVRGDCEHHESSRDLTFKPSRNITMITNLTEMKWLLSSSDPLISTLIQGMKHDSFYHRTKKELLRQLYQIREDINVIVTNADKFNSKNLNKRIRQVRSSITQLQQSLKKMISTIQSVDYYHHLLEVQQTSGDVKDKEDLDLPTQEDSPRAIDENINYVIMPNARRTILDDVLLAIAEDEEVDSEDMNEEMESVLRTLESLENQLLASGDEDGEDNDLDLSILDDSFFGIEGPKLKAYDLSQIPEHVLKEQPFHMLAGSTGSMLTILFSIVAFGEWLLREKVIGVTNDPVNEFWNKLAGNVRRILTHVASALGSDCPHYRWNTKPANKNSAR